MGSANGAGPARDMGFGGCVIGFVKPTHAAVAAEDIQEAYRKQHPEVADQAAVYLAETADGANFL